MSLKEVTLSRVVITLSTVFMLEVWGVCELSKNKKMHPAKQNRRGRMKKVLKAYASGFIEVELR